MAIFHGRDVRLPLLTQLYQVDDTNSDELDLLKQRFSGNEESPENSGSFLSDEDFYEYLRQRSYRDMREAIHTIRPVMDAFADDGCVSGEFLTLLTHELVRTRLIQPMLVREQTRERVSLEPVPITDQPIRIKSVRFTSEDLDALASAFLNALHVALLDRAEFLRCEECRNPFIVTRPERNGGRQSYCSHRCGARASARNKRASLRSKLEALENNS